MASAPKKIRFKTKLLRPASPKGAAWAFLVLPASASAKLPTRSMVTVDGTLEGQPFQATLEPDGEGSHWLKVDKGLREAAGAEVGDTVAPEIPPVEQEPEHGRAARRERVCQYVYTSVVAVSLKKK